MAMELMLEHPGLTATPVRPVAPTLPCERAREIILEDLRPEPRSSVSHEEYSSFMWHMCWCEECMGYERALDAPWWVA